MCHDCFSLEDHKQVLGDMGAHRSGDGKKERSTKGGSLVTRVPWLASIERDGEVFFQSGLLIVNTLQRFCEQLKARRFGELNEFYAASFSGSGLGLNELMLDSERDGIRTFHFQGGAQFNRSHDAMAEWQRYIQSFNESEEISFHLDKIEDWKARGPLVTT